MNDPSRYQQAHGARTTRRRLPRAVWVAAIATAVVALVVFVVLLATGGHDPSQFNHG